MQKLVSAIVTTHNRCELLEKAVNSVINQSYQNIEIIIIDDNSSDNTLKYLKEIAERESRLRFVHIGETETKGGNHARNVGINKSNGDYVAFLDDDDEWLPDKIQKQVEILDNNDKIGLVYCSFYSENDEGNRKECIADPKYSGNLKELCFQKIFCTTSMMLVRRNLLIEVGKFDEELRYWQDYDLLIRISEKTEVAYAQAPLMILRELSKDKDRLTNKYDGWQKAVEYIQNKYFNRISNLPSDIFTEHKLMILRDRAIRCDKAGLDKEKRACLKKIWQITRKPKHFVKYILNYPYFI